MTVLAKPREEDGHLCFAIIQVTLASNVPSTQESKQRGEKCWSPVGLWLGSCASAT